MMSLNHQITDIGSTNLFLEIVSQLANICPRENMLGAVYIEKNNLNNNNKTNKTYGSLPLNCFMAQKLVTNQT